MRVSKDLFGTKERPRVCIFRSNKYIYGQALDDTTHHTLASFSSKEVEEAKKTKSEAAFEAGKKLGELLLKKDIKEVVFDRRRFQYGGRVKQFAEGLRASGIKV